MKRFKFNQSGSSMVEMLGVLTVAGMLGFGVLKIISAVHGVFIQNMVVDEARDLQKKITERFRFDGDYTDGLFHNRDCDGEDNVAQYLCENKIAPFSMCSNGKLHHRGGGAVKVCQHDDNDKYYIVFHGLSKRSCVALAQADWVIRKKSYIYDMTVNPEDESKKTVIYSNYYQEDDVDNVDDFFPVGTSKAMEICNNGDDNTIQLTFF